MLDGKTAFVTGAGRNVGEGIAQELAANGASVIVNDIEQERAESVAGSLPEEGEQRHMGIAADATDPDAVQSMADEIREEYGGLDILVNNLGYAENKSVFDISVEEWDRVFDLTLRSTFLCTKYVGEVIADDGGGAIVNIASRVGKVGKAEKSAYCSSKAAVLNFTRQTAIDLAEDDVRVNSVSPGLAGADPVGQESGGDIEDRSGPDIPLGRIGYPVDVGNAVVFLASDMAEYITGGDLPVDGGLGA